MADDHRCPTTPSAASRPSIEALEDELTTLAAHLNAGNYRFLALLAEFDRRGGHVGWGIASCAHWLSWKCSISLVAAREKVRVARALTTLPKLADAMRRGVLSYCKLRALTRIATPENEAFLLELAQTATVTHLEKVVRLHRKTDRTTELAAANAQRAARSLRCYHDDDGALVIEARLDPEQGALVRKALQAAADTLRRADRDSRESCAAPDKPEQPYSARQADALALLSETFLASGAVVLAAGDRHLVTVHVDERVLRDESQDGHSHIEDGPFLPPATVRRLCCDGALVPFTENAQGKVLDVGRKTRAVPAATRRALDARDSGCRFPGCANTRFVDAHHIEHWADGGETNLDNLVLLCRRHHRFVHEYGFQLNRNASNTGLVVTRPNGEVVQTVPSTRSMDADAGCTALLKAHQDSGLQIAVRTAMPKWMGERMDYGEAVGALRDLASTV